MKRSAAVRVAACVAVVLLAACAWGAAPSIWFYNLDGDFFDPHAWDTHVPNGNDTWFFFVEDPYGWDSYTVFFSEPPPQTKNVRVGSGVVFDLYGHTYECGAVEMGTLSVTSTAPGSRALWDIAQDITLGPVPLGSPSSSMRVGAGVDAVVGGYILAGGNLEFSDGATLSALEMRTFNNDDPVFDHKDLVVRDPGTFVAFGEITGGDLPYVGWTYGEIHIMNEGHLQVRDTMSGDRHDAPIFLDNGILECQGSFGDRGVTGYGVAITEYGVAGPDYLEDPAKTASLTRDLHVVAGPWAGSTWGRQYVSFISAGPAEVQGEVVLDATSGDRLTVIAENGLNVMNGALRLLGPSSGTHYLTVKGNIMAENGIIEATGQWEFDTDGGPYGMSGYGVVMGPGITFTQTPGTVDLTRDLDVRALDAVVYSDGPAGLGPSTTLAGGTLTAPNGVVLESGEEISGHGEVAGAIQAAASSHITAQGGPLLLGNAADLDGFATGGHMTVASGASLTLRSLLSAPLGVQTLLDGATLTADHGVSLGAGDRLLGSGQVAGPLTALLGSTIQAYGNLRLGSAAAFNGFVSEGELAVGPHLVTLDDRDRAVLGSLTTVGDATGPGSLAAPNGLLVGFGKVLYGHGTVDAEVQMNGLTCGEGPGPADELEFLGPVSGVGDFLGNVRFSGGYSPGLSPVEVTFENVSFGAGNVLTMELGGLCPGSEHDRLVVTGVLEPDGALAVMLINGFHPQDGHTFDLFDWGDLDGAFLPVDLPALDPGLAWDTSALYTTGTIGVVPEPATLALVGMGLAGMAALRRRRR